MYTHVYTLIAVCMCVCVLGIQSSVSFLLPLLSPQSQSSRMPINGWFSWKEAREKRKWDEGGSERQRKEEEERGRKGNRVAEG